MEKRFEAVAKAIADEAYAMHEYELPLQLLKPKAVEVESIEGSMIYLDCGEDYSLIWNDVVTEVMGKIDPLNGHWITDDPGTLYGPDERVLHQRNEIEELLDLALPMASDVYALVMDLLAARGWLILPWSEGSDVSEEALGRMVLKDAQDQLAGKFGEEVRDAYQYMLEEYAS